MKVNKGLFLKIAKIERTMMVRATILLLVLLYAGMEPAYAQLFNRGEPVDRGEPIFTPLKNLRERAGTGLPATVAGKAKEACASCKLKGKLFPEAACKRCQAQKEKEAEEAAEKEKDEKTKEAELKKLEAEAKKAELEAKKLEEDDKERNKPWDIADKENAELGDLLAAAAAAKKEQDLAPKKQQALDYLASLGCNKDPNVTKAVLAGLKDYNVEVRKTAVQAVIYAVQGPEGLQYQTDPFGQQPFYQEPVYQDLGPVYQEPVSGEVMGGFGSTQQPESTTYTAAQGDAPAPEEDCPACKIAEMKKLAKEARKQQRKARRDNRGQCNNCGSAGACGCSNVIYGAPACEVPSSSCGCDSCGTGHDSCISCCDPKIMEELKKMAFDPDPKRPGCYYEPSIDVRNLALQAYNLCPAPPKDEEDPEVTDTPGVSEGKGGKDKKKGISEGSGGDEPITLPAPEPDDSDEEENGSESDELENGEALYFSPQSNFQGANDSRMLRGRVSRFLNAGYEIQYSNEFEIPAGNRLYISSGNADSHVAEVVSSRPGNAVLKVVEGRFAGRGSLIRIGVMR